MENTDWKSGRKKTQRNKIFPNHNQFTTTKEDVEYMSLNFTKHGSRDHKKMVIYTALKQTPKDKP
ncbi:uncharacterized protein TOL2_C37680 [Desulfobacula toluolica Tol2]|uniref:Uncharacterized protein n=1 Tax=Desulfobacula toluolica (strain DSM 7467 / Tol2) TaxID=651182 RepID=K0NBV5_DESTT|nr:uncharacterized protein TOL2_C37680 [Desulfobacula toluolica Tol2]